MFWDWPPCWRHLKLKIKTRTSASRFMYKSNNFWNKWAHSFLFQSEPDNKNTVSNITTTYPCIMLASAIMFSRDCCSRCRCSLHYSQTLFTYSYQSHMQDLHWSASQSLCHPLANQFADCQSCLYKLWWIIWGCWVHVGTVCSTCKYTNLTFEMCCGQFFFQHTQMENTIWAL